jgi:hypothetical protein
VTCAAPEAPTAPEAPSSCLVDRLFEALALTASLSFEDALDRTLPAPPRGAQRVGAAQHGQRRDPAQQQDHR